MLVCVGGIYTAGLINSTLLGINLGGVRGRAWHNLCIRGCRGGLGINLGGVNQCRGRAWHNARGIWVGTGVNLCKGGTLLTSHMTRKVKYNIIVVYIKLTMNTV